MTSTIRSVQHENDRYTAIELNKGERLYLSRTNIRTLRTAYGDPENWPGKPVVLNPVKIEFQSRTVNAIRLEIPVPNPTPLTGA